MKNTNRLIVLQIRTEHVDVYGAHFYTVRNLLKWCDFWFWLTLYMFRNRAKVSPLAEEATFCCSVDILCRGPLGLIDGQGVRELMVVSRATVATKGFIVCAVLACDSHTKAPNAYTTLLTLEHSVKLFCPASNRPIIWLIVLPV